LTNIVAIAKGQHHRETTVQCVNLNSSISIHYAEDPSTKAISLFVFLVLVLAAASSQVSADVTFPQNGSTLTYAILTTAKTSQGNITAASTDSYSFQQIGNQWNVTETISGKITCSPPAAQLSVRFHTTSDIMGANSSVSSAPNIEIKVSYLIQDRMVKSTLIGPNVPAGYSAKCTLGGNDVGSVDQATGALYASSLRYYVLFYIQTIGVTEGTLVPVSLLTATISGTQNVAVSNTSRPALVGTLTGLISGSLYWDKDSGILLLAESTSGAESEKMLLINSIFPFTTTTSATASQATVRTSETSVSTSILTTQTQTAIEPWPLTTAGLIGIGLVALAAVVVLALGLQRRYSAGRKAVERQNKANEIKTDVPKSYGPAIPASPKLAPEPESEYKVCRYCGGKIPKGIAKCPECGITPSYMGAD